MSLQIDLDAELSSESDRLPHPTRIAMWLHKYEALPMYKLKEILKHNFKPDDIKIAIYLYMEHMV